MQFFYVLYVYVCAGIVTELSDLRDTVQVERYQDQAQAMLREHALTVAATRPPRRSIDCPLPDLTLTDDPHNRFGRLLLVLPLLKTVKPRALELAFFRGAASPLTGSITPLPVERLLCEMFKNW